MWKGLVTQTQDQALTELLTINETIRAYGLVLTPHDVKHLISARNEALHNYGRIEFGFDVSRRLIEEFARPFPIHRRRELCIGAP